MAIGSGVEMMESMAIVVIGGLIMSTLLTLILGLVDLHVVLPAQDVDVVDEDDGVVQCCKR